MSEDFSYIPSTFMFNYYTGEIGRDFNKTYDDRWRAITSRLYPFPVSDVKKIIQNVEKIFCSSFGESNNGGKVFWGYIAVRNPETKLLDCATF